MARLETAVFCVAFLAVTHAGSQEYPNRPIRIIVSTAGSSGDNNARMLAPRISGPLGQQVIVENRPGVTTAETVAKSPPDGYMLLHDGSSLWIGPLLQEMRYDVFRDFTPITNSSRSPSVLAVHPSVPVKSIKELIALAKARPGDINYGTASTGALSHLGAELFKSMAGVNIVRIPYKGGGSAVAGILSGEVQMIFNSAGSLTQYTKSGRLRALGVASLQPSALAPGLPTIGSAGLPGFEVTSIHGIFAPANTPEAIVKRLNQEIVRALNATDVKEKYLQEGFEVVASTPEGLAATVKSEVATWGKVIKSAGIRTN